MRELKFRAWFNRFEKMVYEVDKDTFDLWKGYWNGKIHIVYPDDGDVVEQYTGLKDKNGKEIYEGDIVKLWDREPELVVWDNLIGAYDPLSWETFDTDECEIIGNIHENPELLGGEE